MYYDYREPVNKIPSHRMLAIRRGENENVLYFSIELDPERPLAYLKSQVLKQPGDWTPQLELAIAGLLEAPAEPLHPVRNPPGTQAAGRH